MREKQSNGDYFITLSFFNFFAGILKMSNEEEQTAPAPSEEGEKPGTCNNI